MSGKVFRRILSLGLAAWVGAAVALASDAGLREGSRAPRTTNQEPRTLPASDAGLRDGFRTPPPQSRPWVYWFWLNGNITREGITADLEAMNRAGIGGVLIMEVDQGAPVGPVKFMSAEWRALFKHVLAEAQRLGLEVNMNNDAGWEGSGGPWVKAEQSMQKIVWTETAVEGPKKFDGKLPQPAAVAGFYRDITVLAFPSAGEYRIADMQCKALASTDLMYLYAHDLSNAFTAGSAKVPPESAIDRGRIANLGALMGKDGHLAWDVPKGRWTLMRVGHTSTGANNSPAPASGCGLECDKLDKAALDAHFDAVMAKLIGDAGPAAGTGKTLVSTHIDSWECGMQNWTSRMREEFQKRRGYDLLPFLPVVSGRVVQSLDVSERFLWDLRRTVSELVVENYAGHMQELAHRHGLRLSIEPYVAPCNDLVYAGRADEPMCEFWMNDFMFPSCKGVSSTSHVYGKRITGAESWTSGDTERWLIHPGNMKALCDRAFAVGVNRFVFHRYAMQPWLNYKPGMTMGPWGLHYERTQTWWAYARPWHQYVARCQFLLRQGLFAADICALQSEDSPQDFPKPFWRDRYGVGYDYDFCPPEALLTCASVRDGRLVLPDGMSYRILALSDGRPNDARLAAEDSRFGAGWGDGGRPAADAIAEPGRLSSVRRGSEAARGRNVGRLRRQDRPGTPLGQRKGRLRPNCGGGPRRNGRCSGFLCSEKRVGIGEPHPPDDRRHGCMVCCQQQSAAG